MIARKPLIENAGIIFGRVIERISKRTEVPEFPFGITQLDELTHGIARERVSIIAARPSEGKTSFGLQTAYRNAAAGKMVAYISLEDDREQLVEKLFCNVFSLDNTQLKRGLSPTIEAAKPNAEQMFSNLRLIALDGFGYNFSELRNVVMMVNPKPELIFLDYIQMIDGVQKESRWETISEFIRQVKKFALDEKIAIVILSQINRGGVDVERPSLHHLKQAGTLEEVADLVLILHHPFRYGQPSYDYSSKNSTGIEQAPQDYLEVQIEKNKTGRIGIVPVKFEGQFYKFSDWETWICR